LCILSAVTLVAVGSDARAEWPRTSDIDQNTAYTLEEGSISVGIFSPLIVGVTESFQASIHPLLLLPGHPSVALRLRLTPVDDVTVALNLAGAWSFIRSETADGRPKSQAADGEDVGYPGTLQLGATVTFALARDWLVSVGAGPGEDFLGSTPIRTLVEVHASVHWLPSPRHLLMLQANGYLDVTHGGALVRPGAQMLYSYAASARVELAVGLGLGDWIWEETSGARRTVNWFPLLDVIFRF